MRKYLFVFNWVGEGYNQVYAFTEAEAIELANKIAPPLKVDVKTLRKLETTKEEAAYYKSIGLWD
jgi:hypothetical protein